MATLCAGTPTITVRDGRALAVRTLRYNRGRPGDIATQLVEAHIHNVLGQPAASQDARFFAEGGASPTHNFQYTPALSGQVLRTVSADAGTTKALTDIEGRPIWERSLGRNTDFQDENEITVTHSYDALGRPTARWCGPREIGVSISPLWARTDVWCHGESTPLPATPYDAADITDPRNANLRGRLLRHYDTAGVLDMSARGYNVQGSMLRQDRRLLAYTDPCHNWDLKPDALKYELDQTIYSTAWTHNAAGQVLTRTDAKGHRQQTAYDMAGRKVSNSVTPYEGNNTPVAIGVTYTADGLVDTQTDTNGIRTVYTYEPQTTQRVLTITTTRGAASAKVAARRRAAGRRRPASGTATLQDLTYTYDGAGNVTALNDACTPVTYFRNMATGGGRAYDYDALYRLISATGRENYVSGTPSGTDSPDVVIPLNAAQYRAYTRTYQYDPGGNLSRIASNNPSGTGATVPTRNMTVGDKNNRALGNVNQPGLTADKVDGFFDSAGQSIYLDGNKSQPMYWTPFHQLYVLVSCYRELDGYYPGFSDWALSDCEYYAYDSTGQRVRKSGQGLISGVPQSTTDAIYLPGLELRRNYQTGEQLEVIVLDDGARMLNWTANKPSGIANRQIRYRYSDRQNSCRIETDNLGAIITQEAYYPYGGTAVSTAVSASAAKYKTMRYSGKERDAAGLYYYGLRYYQPWIGRWINPDPARTIAGQNLYCMVGNNPVTARDVEGLAPEPELRDALVIASSDPAGIHSKVLHHGQEAMTRQSALGAMNASASGHAKAYIKKYSQDSNILVNTYLRTGKETIWRDLESEPAPLDSSARDNVTRRVADLAAIVDDLPQTGAVKLYRGTSVARQTAGGNLLPVTGLAKGDWLVNTDFLSFAENPYTVGRSFVDLKTNRNRQHPQGVLPTTAIFVMEAGPSAKAMAPYSHWRHEAESIIRPGAAFRVEEVETVTLPDDLGSYTQVSLAEARPDAGTPLPERTFAFFDRKNIDWGEFRRRLGDSADRILQPYGH